MNQNPPPLDTPGPLSLRRYGCLVILAVLVALVVGVAFGVRYVFVSTAIPFRAVAQMIEKANPNVKFTGISGDLSTGPRVESVTWGDSPEKRSEILDLRVKYNGYADAAAKKRIVIEDVGVKKAHFDLADFGAVTRTATTSGNSSTSSGTPTTTGPTSTSAGSNSFFNDMESFEVKQVLIEDVLITNRNSDFRLSIPKISWTGFKVTKTTVDAGELHVESDRLTLHTAPGRTLPLSAGEKVTFQKSLTGRIEPLLHPSILQPIVFALDYSFVPEVKAPAFHFSAADDKVEIGTTADGGQALHIRQLDIAAYLDAKKLYGAEAADFPSQLVLEAVAAPENGPVKIVSGSFLLGVSTFQVQPREIPSGDAGTESELRASLHIEEGEIVWSLPLKEWPNQCRPVFKAQPELPPKEILARVFAGKKYADLTPEEKQKIDARIPAYFSSPGQ